MRRRAEGGVWSGVPIVKSGGRRSDELAWMLLSLVELEVEDLWYTQ